jgi:hypothetical protein
VVPKWWGQEKGGRGEVKRRKSMYTGAYDVVSDARERVGDMGCEGKRDIEGECLYSPLRG